jgi:hypothetical protein
MIDESFAIQLRNHKTTDAVVRVVEHLQRGRNWAILESSHPYEAKGSDVIQFTVGVPKDGETTVTYTVRYTVDPRQAR